MFFKRIVSTHQIHVCEKPESQIQMYELIWSFLHSPKPANISDTVNNATYMRRNRAIRLNPAITQNANPGRKLTVSE